MKESMTFLGLLLIVSTASAQTAKVSCSQNGTVMELISTENAGLFQMRTTRKNGSQETSQPMACSIDASENVLNGAVCTQSILNLKFIRNSATFFSITHEMVIPGKPDLKDPMAGSYGDQFDCQVEGK